ncbi:MAG: hypothetical protein AAFQ68_10820, partial [Bacteroidota bacterium]
LREQVLSQGSIDRFVSDSRVKAENVNVRSVGNNIRFHEQGYHLPAIWPEDIRPQIVKDPLAENNYAMTLKSAVKGWRMSMYLSDEYDGSKDYQLKVAMRVDWKNAKVQKENKTHDILRVLVYDEKTKGVLLKRSIRPADVKDNAYTVLEIGDFTPKHRDRIIVLPVGVGKEVIESFYVDFIELVPK